MYFIWHENNNENEASLYVILFQYRNTETLMQPLHTYFQKVDWEYGAKKFNGRSHSKTLEYSRNQWVSKADDWSGNLAKNQEW